MNWRGRGSRKYKSYDAIFILDEDSDVTLYSGWLWKKPDGSWMLPSGARLSAMFAANSVLWVSYMPECRTNFECVLDQLVADGELCSLNYVNERSAFYKHMAR